MHRVVVSSAIATMLLGTSRVSGWLAARRLSNCCIVAENQTNIVAGRKSSS